MIGIGIGIGFMAGIASGYDVDAAAFFARVTAAGGTLTLTEKNATNTLVVQMKADGIWTAMKAVYPMIGSSAAACAQNLKSASFTGTFSSGWTFASTGVTGNGVSSYMDTLFNPITQSQAQNSTYLSIYVRNNTASGYDMGNSQDLGIAIKPTYIISRYSSNQWYLGIADTGYATALSSFDSRGFWSGGTNGSSAQILYRNGSSLLTGTSSQSGFFSSNLYLGAVNGGGTALYSTDHQYVFTTISDGLSPTQNANFYTAVQAFQTTLNRYVDAPWYNNGNLLLDTYPSAAAAYSVRKLRNNYIGGPIRVRRSSDNAEQDIYFDANGNLDTAQLTTFCSGTNGFVTTWYDQSGNARNALQATAANQPQIVNSGAVLTLNSKPALNWNGTNYWLITAQFSPAISQPATYFITAQSNTGSNNALFDGFTNAQILYYRASTNFSFVATTILSESTAAAATQLLYTNLANTTSSAFYNNGVSKASGNVGTNGIDGIVIGNLGSTFQSAGFHLRGNYQELVLYPSNQTSNQTAIESNINTYYAIY